MKILITTPIFPPEIGGPATYTMEVSRRLKERGHQIRVVTFTDSRPEIKDLEILPVRISYRIPGSFLRQVRLFLTILRAAKGMELIYSQGSVVVGLTSLIVGKLIRKPVMVKFVGDIAWENAVNRGRTSRLLEDFLSQPEGGLYIRLIMWIQKFVFHSADKIITPSNHLRNVLVKYYQVPTVKIKVIYNAVELPEGKAVAEKYGQPVVITISRLVPWKDIDEIIELVPTLVEEYPDFKLLVVGHGPENKKLRKLCQEIGAEQQVMFAGKVSHEQTLEFLRGSDIFVLNSVYEGLPHVVIEAMACQIPVIATNIKGTNEVVINGETGLLVTPHGDEELKDKIIQLLNDKRLRERLVKNAYNSVEERFTWEKNIGMLERELEDTAHPKLRSS